MQLQEHRNGTAEGENNDDAHKETDSVYLLRAETGSSPRDAPYSMDIESQPQPARFCSRCSCLTDDPLLLYTLVGVVFGIVLGLCLRPIVKPSSVWVEIIGLAGEIVLRLLKLMVLPLIAVSMVCGVCSLRQSGGNMARVVKVTLLSYLATCVAAVMVGIAVVVTISPGRSAAQHSTTAACSTDAVNVTAASSELVTTSGDASTLDTLLGVLRSMFPDNVVAAAVNMNVLGIITFSLLFGVALASCGDEVNNVVALLESCNKVIGKMVLWIIWMSPPGIASLIAANILKSCNIAAAVASLGLFTVTVLLGLALQAFVVLPLFLFATTRRTPWRDFRGFAPGMATAFGTDSSAAALPVTMMCAESLGCSPDIVKFVLPLGTTINMNGTALYEAVTVIFIAQMHGVRLGVAELIVVAFTATLAACGAAAIPSAGLVTMIIVLQAVSLDRFAKDIAMVMVIDWLLDRCRTVVNVIGDAFVTVAVDHMAKQNASADDSVDYDVVNTTTTHA